MAYWNAYPDTAERKKTELRMLFWMNDFRFGENIILHDAVEHISGRTGVLLIVRPIH